MKKAIHVAAAALFGATGAPANAVDYHAEITEWVMGPCMEVAAALGVGQIDEESIKLGIRRAHLAKLAVAERDKAIREVAQKMNADATWGQRRAAYPVLLKVCIRNLPGMKR